jgi:hypothetical protein
MSWPSVVVVLGLLVAVGLAFDGALTSIERNPGYLVIGAILVLVFFHERALSSVIKLLDRFRGR